MDKRKTKLRLDTLCSKFREGPSRSVVNESSRTSPAILRIAEMPSPIVLPSTKSADIVAEAILLQRYKLGGSLSSVVVTKLSIRIKSPLLFRTCSEFRSNGLFLLSSVRRPTTQYCRPSILK